LYEKLIKEILEKKREIVEKISELQKQKRAYENVYNSIKELQSQYDKENNNLAYQKGICPFPKECDQKDYCTKGCNADTCNNGHAYRMS